MKSDQTDRELAAAELVAAAQTHLQQVHPTVVKSHEEVDADIHEHMVVVGSGPAV